MTTLWLRDQPIGTIKGVLFDKDGTLSNSESHLLNLAELRVQEALRLFHEEGESWGLLKELKKLMSKAYGITKNGLSPDGIIAIASRENNLISTATILCILGKTWPKAVELSNKIFLLVDDVLDENKSSPTRERKLLPGAQKLLKNLHNANVKCALISNDSRLGVQNFLSKNNLNSLMSNFWSADHFPAKPDPEAVEALCTKLNLHPSQCALIGDADSDLLMARQSGIGIRLGYTGGWTKKPRLTEHQYLIHNWDELTIQQNKPYSAHKDNDL